MTPDNPILKYENRQYKIYFTSIGFPIDSKLITEDLGNSVKQSKDGIEVEVEQVGSEYKSIKAKPVPKSAKASTHKKNQQEIAGEGDFHNPYNFIPAPPRKTDGPLGDHEPVGHDALLKDCWTGKIHVKAKLVTPLLLPDAGKLSEEDKHKTYPVRISPDGKPYIPPTSIKGMFRSAYEAITNSRMGVLEKHDLPLGFRMSTEYGLRLVPAQIRKNDEGELNVYLLPGCSKITDDGKPEGMLTYSARIGLDDAKEYAHGDPISLAVWKDGLFWEADLPTTRPENKGAKLKEITGFVCKTNLNTAKKKHERVFFVDPEHKQIDHLSLHLDETVKKNWNTLINNYRQNTELKDGAKRPSTETDTNVVWSRHMTDDKDLQLYEGALVYAEVRGSNNIFRLLGLYPVCIARKLFSVSPADLLPGSLKPANLLRDLSPADRIFGWVNPEGNGAYRGQLRIGQVQGLTKDHIDDFKKHPIPLAILSQPKPHQGRFYVAKDKDGNAQDTAIFKEKAGYDNLHKGLRGRKVYPHHVTLQESLYLRQGKVRDKQNRSIEGWIRVDSEFAFDIHVTNMSHVELGALLWLVSLSEWEKTKSLFHRLGGGKPLGFGSVQLTLDWEETDLRSGAEWQNYYRQLQPVRAIPAREELAKCVDDFRIEVLDKYGDKIPAGKKKNFANVPFVAAFLVAAHGFSDKKPIHYPRRTPLLLTGSEDAKIFEWFSENERVVKEKVDSGPKKYVVVHGNALPNLAEENHHALPYL